MKSFLLLIAPIILLSCANDGSTTQSPECVETSSAEANIIDLPDWFGDDEPETIRKIEAQNSRDYADYLQLAVSYAALDDTAKVIFNIDRALTANTKEACKLLIFQQTYQQDWKISCNHREAITSRLHAFNCI